eukprot:maker-scaffold_2-snap-gene-19.37-mRNA-1 protein AED:0.00 eAED:0.00 QI:24/1/1/1/1/1/2/385/296
MKRKLTFGEEKEKISFDSCRSNKPKDTLSNENINLPLFDADFDISSYERELDKNIAMFLSTDKTSFDIRNKRNLITCGVSLSEISKLKCSFSLSKFFQVRNPFQDRSSLSRYNTLCVVKRQKEGRKMKIDWKLLFSISMNFDIILFDVLILCLRKQMQKFPREVLECRSNSATEALRQINILLISEKTTETNLYFKRTVFVCNNLGLGFKTGSVKTIETKRDQDLDVVVLFQNSKSGKKTGAVCKFCIIMKNLTQQKFVVVDPCWLYYSIATGRLANTSAFPMRLCGDCDNQCREM